MDRSTDLDIEELKVRGPSRPAGARLSGSPLSGVGGPLGRPVGFAGAPLGVAPPRTRRADFWGSACALGLGSPPCRLLPATVAPSPSGSAAAALGVPDRHPVLVIARGGGAGSPVPARWLPSEVARAAATLRSQLPAPGASAPRPPARGPPISAGGSLAPSETLLPATALPREGANSCSLGGVGGGNQQQVGGWRGPPLTQ